MEKVVIKVRAKVVREKNLKIDAQDVTPKRLECPRFTDVVIEEGLDIESDP
jgi:hypothetical protein